MRKTQGGRNSERASEEVRGEKKREKIMRGRAG